MRLTGQPHMLIFMTVTIAIDVSILIHLGLVSPGSAHHYADKMNLARQQVYVG